MIAIIVIVIVRGCLVVSGSECGGGGGVVRVDLFRHIEPPAGCLLSCHIPLLSAISTAVEPIKRVTPHPIPYQATTAHVESIESKRKKELFVGRELLLSSCNVMEQVV